MDTMRYVSSLHCQKVHWVYISLPLWMHVYRCSINASKPMNCVFTEFILSRFYVTLYLLSYCVFHFYWCRVYIYLYIHMHTYPHIYLYMPANACNYLYVIICMFSCVLILCMLILLCFLPIVAWSEMT